MSMNVTQESIAALKTMSTRLQELQKDLQAGASSLEAAFNENKDGLGAHSTSILTLIQELKKYTGDVAGPSGPVKKLVKRLQVSADVRQKHIDTDHYNIHRK